MSDPLWWQIWWPWMLLWLLTAASVVLAAVLAVVYWRSRRRRRGLLAVAFYLSTSAIMDLYRQLRYQPALRRAVSDRLLKSGNTDIGVSVGMASWGAGGQVDHEVFRSYIEEDEPITVIGILMDVLQDMDDIIYADLDRLTVTPNRRLRVALPRNAQQAGLLGPDAFVLVQGTYRPSGGDAEQKTFRAPYGPAQDTWVRIDCAQEGLRRGVPAGTFLARCLGRVERWDATTRELVVDPIAVFK